MSFSDRVLGNAGVGPWPLVLAMKDQLLVRTNFLHEEAAPAWHVRDHLGQKEIETHLMASLLDHTVRPGVPEGEDIDILHVDLDGHDLDIFDVVREIRADDDLAQHLQGPRSVSPNHILVPQNEDHSCPYGPPWATADAPDIGPPIGETKRVVVIDSGYQWDGPAESNPLHAYGGGPNLFQAERVADPGWTPSDPDIPDANQPGTLGALSGHANFIAGVIAQQTRHASISVWNHNGAFPTAADDLPTEAAIIRSLCHCAADSPDVINLGFAFAAFDSVVSYAWDIGFDCIRPTAINKNAVVVSPAGNQHSPHPRYPAALNTRYPGEFPEMISVGSTTDANAHKDDPELAALVQQIPTELRKPFSNYGPWVTCSIDGALVLSTFLNVDMKVEEPPSRTTNFANAWARWSGTSFATPKIVAKIVDVMVERGLTPLQAWEWLRDNEGGPKTSDLGYRFS